MQNTNNLSKKELCEWLENEISIKNHLYYYMLLSGQIASYRTYLMVHSTSKNELEKRDSAAYRALAIINNWKEVGAAEGRLKVNYDLNPN